MKIPNLIPNLSYSFIFHLTLSTSHLLIVVKSQSYFYMLNNQQANLNHEYSIDKNKQLIHRNNKIWISEQQKYYLPS